MCEPDKKFHVGGADPLLDRAKDEHPEPSGQQAEGKPEGFMRKIAPTLARCLWEALKYLVRLSLSRIKPGG